MINQKDITEYCGFLGHDCFDVRAFTPIDNNIKVKVSDTMRATTVKEVVDFCEKYDKKANMYLSILPKKKGDKTKKGVTQLDKIWLDIDVKREFKNKDSTASKALIKETLEVAERIGKDFSEHSGIPLIVFTQNGHQVTWAIKPIELTEENREDINAKLKIFLKLVRKKYGTEHVEIDPAVADIARILKIPGIVGVKGEEKHWRLTKIVQRAKQTKEQKKHMTEQFLLLENPKIIKGEIQTVDIHELKTDPILDYLITKGNRLPHGTLSNHIILKNFAVRFVQCGLSDEEIQKGIGLKLVNQCDGRTITMLNGWLQKVHNGEIVDFNKAELNKWINDHKIPIKKYTDRKARELHFISGEDLVNKDYPPKKWLVEGLIPEDDYAVIGGLTGVYKSYLSLHMADCIANGKKFLGEFDTSTSEVLYIDEENNEAMSHRRLKRLKSNGKRIHFLILENINFSKISDKETIFQYLEDHPNIKTIMIDTFNKVFRLHEENRAEELTRILVEIVKFSMKKYGVSWLFLHHFRKNYGLNNTGIGIDEFRGSSEFSNQAHTLIALETLKGTTRFNLHVLKNREGEIPKPMKCEAVFDDTEKTTEFKFLEYVERTESVVEKILNEIISYMLEQDTLSFTTKKIQEIMKNKGFKRSNITGSLSLGVTNKKLIRPSKGNYVINREELPDNNSKAKGQQGHTADETETLISRPRGQQYTPKYIAGLGGLTKEKLEFHEPFGLRTKELLEKVPNLTEAHILEFASKGDIYEDPTTKRWRITK